MRLFYFWRKMWASNPRNLSALLVSNQLHSAALPTLRTTGSDTGIRTQDLRDMSPTRTTSPPYRNKLAGSQGFEPCTCRLTADRTCLMCFLPKFGGFYWIPTSHRSIGILPDSDYRLLRTQGTPIEPLSLQVQKLVVNVGIEPTGPESTVLQTAEANHIAHIHQ